MKRFFIILLLFCFGNSFSQELTNEYWSSISFSKKLVKKTHLSAELGYRFEDILDNNAKLFELGVTRKLPNKFKIGGSYRYSSKSNYKREFRKVHRASLSLSKGIKIKGFKFSFRSKFQWEYKNRVSEKKSDLTDLAWRNKLKISKKVYKRTNVYLGSEIFAFESPQLLDRYRFHGGIKYGITKRIEISLQAVYEAQFYDVDRISILSFSYSQRL